ncbi:MAG TPA: aminopeptidase [Thermomicrobiales bacterium]|nr:aminopeptidase [Thermomicrobiales bacterium]
MFDPRWSQLGEILVNYSTRTGAGDRLLITMMEPETFPLSLAVYEHAVRVGAFPQVQFASAYMERVLLKYGNEELIARVPDLERAGMEWADTYIGLRGARNPYELTDIPSDRVALHKQAMGAISTSRNEQTRWVLVRVPNEAFAQAAGMSLEAMMGFFFNATLRDWVEESRRYRRLHDLFQAAERVRIVGCGTDLTFSTAGRTYVVGDGHINIPDGELYTAPVDDSAQGVISFEFPGSYAGQQITGIRLEFQDGEVVTATAKTGESFLQQVLAMDDGARRIGEFGVGVNFGIDRFVGDILFDEKIGGTIHLGLGRAYGECGGRNQSTLHWDIVKDLRGEGAIELDGRRVFENGRFLVDLD